MDVVGTGCSSRDEGDRSEGGGYEVAIVDYFCRKYRGIELERVVSVYCDYEQQWCSINAKISLFIAKYKVYSIS